jgi:SHS2 domain-containing protein
LGMMSLMLELESVTPAESVPLEAAGSDLKSLLIAWLSEILFQVGSEGWAFAGFDVSEISETRILGSGKGERLDPERHGLKGEIKAATYHMLELDHRDEYWTAQVIFDV